MITIIITILLIAWYITGVYFILKNTKNIYNKIDTEDIIISLMLGLMGPMIFLHIPLKKLAEWLTKVL